MRGHIQLSSVVEKLTRMKAVLSALGVCALFFCVSSSVASFIDKLCASFVHRKNFLRTNSFNFLKKMSDFWSKENILIKSLNQS